MSHPAHIPERYEIAAALRDLRVAGGLSTTSLAKRLGWSQSRVSRLERGLTLPTADDVDQWARVTGAETAVRRRLMELAGQAQVQLTEWKRELAPGRRRKQEEMAQHEASASVIRLFGADVIPGLAQTRPYAAAMFRLGRVGVTDEPEDVAAVLDARMARQSIVDSGKKIELLMSETALHRHLVSGAEQRDQIARLLMLSERPNVRLGVVPFAADERVHQYHGYAVYGDPHADGAAVVLVETLTRGLTIRAADEVEQFIEHFDQLAATAWYGDKLRALLREIASTVSWS